MKTIASVFLHLKVHGTYTLKGYICIWVVKGYNNVLGRVYIAIAKVVGYQRNWIFLRDTLDRQNEVCRSLRKREM